MDNGPTIPLDLPPGRREGLGCGTTFNVAEAYSSQQKPPSAFLDERTIRRVGESVSRKRKGKVVILHLAVQYPFAGVVWQLLHHLVGFRQLGCDVYYLEDNRNYVYDPVTQMRIADAERNLKLVVPVLDRFGFSDKWAFLDPASEKYVGMNESRCAALLREADAAINLCGASNPREEHIASRCLVYLETDPGSFQVKLDRRDPETMAYAAAHKLFFTYAYNIGESDCLLPTAGIEWHRTRPPVLLDEWHEGIGPKEPGAFTTVGTWHHRGSDVEIGGDKFFWSKHVNFVKVLEVAARTNQAIELATDIDSGPDYDRAIRYGFTFAPVVPMSLDIDNYRTYISSSRGEFTVAKDLYTRTRSGWFSDRTVCYLAAGRPVITQSTGFEKYVPAGDGLIAFDRPDGAVEAIKEVNRDFTRHARAARKIAIDYFDALKLLDEMADVIGL
jgi:hypothetical protein